MANKGKILKTKGKLKSRIPEINETFDYWTVIDNNIQEISKGQWAVKCKCKCGKESFVRVFALIRGESLGCPCRRIVGIKSTTICEGDLSQTLYSRFKKSAVIRDLEWNVTMLYLWDLYLKQDKKCALSGIDLVLEKALNRVKGQANITASLDRIDSSIGYIEGNVQWIHKDINYMKQDLEENYFKQMCKLIGDYGN